MSKGAQRVSRLLREIPYLLSHPGVPLSQVAEEFSITPSEVKKDVELIALCGVPGGLPGDLMEVDYDALEQGEVYLDNSTLTRPLKLSMAEAMSLSLALSTLRATVDEMIRTHIDGLLDKLRGNTLSSIDVSVHEGREDIREQIHHSIHQAQRIRLTYEGQARGVTTYPVVDPVELFVQGGVLFLRGYCVTSRAAETTDSTSEPVTIPGWRNYRLDRIISLTPLDETAEFHDDGEDVWDKKVKEGQSVSLWVSEEARWLGEYHNATTVGVTSDGLTQIDVPVLSESWMIRLLLSLGSAVKRVEPETYSHRARQIAHQTLDAYRLLDGSVVRSDP